LTDSSLAGFKTIQAYW